VPAPNLRQGLPCADHAVGEPDPRPDSARHDRKNAATGEYEIDPDVRNEKTDNILGFILSKCRLLVPNIDASEVIHTFAGIRAKNTTGDWMIGPIDNVPGFINAASIDSPGIAASPAIAKDVARMLGIAGAPVKESNPTFNAIRAPHVVPKKGFKGLKLPKPGPNMMTEEPDPEKNIICKCEKVTEAEVIDVIHRSLPIDSTQAIRKRVRAGMGHCQGDRQNYDCETRVAMIIARETGLSLEEVGRRPWPGSSLMPKRFFVDADRNHLKDLSDPSVDYPLHGAAL